MQEKIVLWSDGAERITGRLRHEVIGRAVLEEGLLHNDQPDHEFVDEDNPLSRAIKTAHPAEGTGSLHHKAGYEIPVRIHAVPVRNEHGSIIGGVEIFESLQPAASLDHREDSLNLPGCIDDVTGVASHLMMQSHLRETLGTFREVDVPFGILLFQLEGLEHFGASFGPEAAASLLRVVARTLESALWRTDFVGRWSDDQFLVILNGCREDAIHSVRERIRRMLASDAIEWWGERRSLPVCVGEATAQPGDSIESLIDRAQKALDRASTGQAQAAAASSRKQSSGS
jgi:diguanylate cyclase (GGDEF)-like protein/PAS domain S-box-containing protein